MPGNDRAGLDDDIASVRRILELSDEPTVVVAHSYGGIVAAEAAEGVHSVRHLVLVSSYLPQPGESLKSFSSDGPAPFLDIDPARGTFTVRADMLIDTFLQDCPPEVVNEAASHLAQQNLAVIEQPVRVAAWQHIPSTYIVCTSDRGTPAEAQRRFAERAGTVVELGAGHHPFLSQPDAVAEVIVNLHA